MRLNDKVCAVTGGGSGIGETACRRFAAEGGRVVVLERNEATGGKVAEQIGQYATFIQLDVSDSDAVADAFSAIDKQFGRLDVLYNNASVFLGKDDGPVTELSGDTWQKIIAINMNGVFHCSKFGIPVMLKGGGGSVINTASSAAVIGIPGCDAYTASKGATVALTRSMAVEYGPRHIRVNCIAPAAIRTPMVRESNLDNSDFDEQAFLRTTPVRRWGTPEEIANIAVFLASDESSYLNGAIIVADGGITIT